MYRSGPDSGKVETGVKMLCRLLWFRLEKELKSGLHPGVCLLQHTQPQIPAVAAQSIEAGPRQTHNVPENTNRT